MIKAREKSLSEGRRDQRACREEDRDETMLEEDDNSNTHDGQDS